MKLSISLPEGDSEVMLDLRYCFESGKHYSTCVIATPHKVVAGAAVLNPLDQNDSRIGYKLAFSRALYQLYPNTSCLNKETRAAAWNFFLQELLKAMTT